MTMNKPTKITRKKLLKELDELRTNYQYAIYSIMEIRQAVGDKESNMPHRELVDKIAALYDASIESETK